MSEHTSKGLMLLMHERWELAIAEFQKALADDPSDVHARGWMAICLAKAGKHREALREAHRTVGYGPDESFAHYSLANVLDHQDKFDPAIRAIDEAIRIDPSDASNFALRARLYAQKNDWFGMLSAANQGLAIDPEHDACVNVRTIALTKLGRLDEAGDTIAAAMRRNPEDSQTHANMGWMQLHRNAPRQAMDHFRESLRIDPHNDWAREGIVHAMRARSAIYRHLLRYLLWMGGLTQKTQWIILTPAILLYLVARHYAETNPALAPWLWPFIFAFLGFGILEITATPIFNLALRLDPLGRHALTRDEIASANLGLVLLSSTLVLVIGGTLGNIEWVRSAGLSCLMFMVPASNIHDQPAGPRRNRLVLANVILAVLCVIVLIGTTMHIKSMSRLVGYVGIGALVLAFFPNQIAETANED